MQYINHKTNTGYSGDRAHWRDIPVTSERPGPHYRPVVEDGEHVGWGITSDGLERARADALARIQEAHAEALKDLVDRYPQTEREGWHELVKDAEAGEGTCIAAYADSAGISVEDAAARILAARAGYRETYGALTGKLTRLRDQIDTAKTIEAIAEILGE